MPAPDEAGAEMAPGLFVPAVSPPPELTARTEAAYWFIFAGDRLLVEKSGEGVTVPLLADVEALRVETTTPHYLGQVSAVPCFATAVAEPSPDAVAVEAALAGAGQLRRLRTLYGALDEELFWIAGRAVQIVHWDLTHRYCGRCGAMTELETDERVRMCPTCGLGAYPRLAPAIIVAVTHGDRLLLARSHRHPPGLFSVLAGFVEPGETLEECLTREVREEVGIEVQNIRYFGSQPWPFPHSLMIAFTCEYAGGKIVLDEAEMAEADWFRADALPRIPPAISISRRLIDWFVAEQDRH